MRNEFYASKHEICMGVICLRPVLTKLYVVELPTNIRRCCGYGREDECRPAR